MQQFHQWLRATGHRYNGDSARTLHSRWRRLVNAEVEHEPYASGNNEPDWAPYVRLATCTEHGLEPVTGHRTIPTGPGDLCDVGTFACGAVVAEDVF